MVPSALRLCALALVAAVAALSAFSAVRQGVGPERASARATTDAPAAPLVSLEATETLARGDAAEAPEDTGRRRPPEPRGYSIARLRTGHTVALRSKPAGPVVDRLGARTEFGSKRVLAVAEVRGRWLGVLVPERPNGKLGWIDGRSAAVDRGRTMVSLRADLSRRRLELRVGSRVVRRITVAVGRPGSTTPTGRFAVTDKLSGGRFGPYYGCCILALSGHQPNPPAGWRGGNRLAVHGTSSPGTIGAAASAGCLRGGDRDLKALMRRAPVGTPIFIRG